MRFLNSFLNENTTPKEPSKPTKPISEPPQGGFVGFVGTGTLVSRAVDSALPDRMSDGGAVLAEGTVKAIRGQHTEWHDLTVDESTTGILICSSILNADIWLALREDFEPDPDLPSFAIFYLREIPLLKDKTEETLRKIHEARLAFNGGKIIPPEEML